MRDNRKNRSVYWITIWGIALFSLAGCGELDDEPPRNVVFGTVTWNGEPVSVGEIRFVPNEGTDAPSSGGEIRDGKYRIENKGGVPLGSFRVIIQGYRAPSKPGSNEIPGAPSDDPMAAREQFLPPKYSGGKSELSITVEVGEPQEANFDLKT